MNIRSWLGAALAVTLISLSAGQGLADARGNFERVERAQPARSQAAHIAQPRPGRMDRAQAAPAPARATRQVQRLEPKPPADAARQRGNSDMAMRAGRATRR
jgi:hypothetical protein